MSTTTKKTSMKGVRYTDAQKQEVIDFATSYNATNGRGGQSKASEKFNISQLSVATWLKAAGAPAPKSVKAPKAPKAPKAAKAPKAPKAAKVGGKVKPGTRYTPEQKKAVTDFVVAYNIENGRGGSSTAVKKFGVSPLTVIAWLKAAGVKGSSNKAKKIVKAGAKAAKEPKAPKVAKVAKAAKNAGGEASGGSSAKLSSMLSLSGQIDKAEAELASLKAKFSSLKASL